MGPSSCGCPGAGNSLITQGYGCSNLAVTRGYGECRQQVTVVEAVARAARRLGRAAEGKFRDILVSAKLLEFNGCEPDPQIVGATRVSIDPTKRVQPGVAVRIIESHVTRTVERIGIRVARFVSGSKE